MKLKRLTAALIAALTAITPFSFHSPAATVFAEGTGVVAALPDWIPSDFESAVEFRNTYGATHIDNGLICIVLLNEYSTPTNDFLRYDTVTTKNALDTVSRKVYSSDMTRTKLEVIVYSPLVQGDIEVDIVDTMIQAPSLELGGRHHKARWEEAFSCWAAVSVKTSTETTEAGVTQEVVSLEFTVRQTPDTKRINTTTHKLRFHGLVYDITGVLPNYKSLDYMKITAGTRKAGEQDDFD